MVRLYGLVLWLVLGSSLTAIAESREPGEQTITLQIIGGLARVHQYTRHEEPFWTRTVTERSKGHVRASIQPFDKSGVMGDEVLKLVRTGVVPFGTMMAGVTAGTRPLWSAADLPGMNADIAQLRHTLVSIRPDLERAILKQDGIVVLAMYAYPAQMVFCRDPIEKLTDLSGLRVRVSNVNQADFVQAVGARPVFVQFADVPLSLKRRSVDCVVTGTMSGYLQGLHQSTSSVLALPINWGISVFGANKEAWASLPASIRDLLKNDLLPKLEQDIWDEANRETDEGLNCLSGNGNCSNGNPGRMTVVKPSVADLALTRRVYTTSVLPSWLHRCDHECDELWTTKLKPLVGQ